MALPETLPFLVERCNNAEGSQGVMRRNIPGGLHCAGGSTSNLTVFSRRSQQGGSSFTVQSSNSSGVSLMGRDSISERFSSPFFPQSPSGPQATRPLMSQMSSYSDFNVFSEHHLGERRPSSVFQTAAGVTAPAGGGASASVDAAPLAGQAPLTIPLPRAMVNKGISQATITLLNDISKQANSSGNWKFTFQSSTALTLLDAPLETRLSPHPPTKTSGGTKHTRNQHAGRPPQTACRRTTTTTPTGGPAPHYLCFVVLASRSGLTQPGMGPANSGQPSPTTRPGSVQAGARPGQRRLSTQDILNKGLQSNLSALKPGSIRLSAHNAVR
eukprot:gene31209-6358_t